MSKGHTKVKKDVQDEEVIMHLESFGKMCRLIAIVGEVTVQLLGNVQYKSMRQKSKTCECAEAVKREQMAKKNITDRNIKENSNSPITGKRQIHLISLPLVQGTKETMLAD